MPSVLVRKFLVPLLLSAAIFYVSFHALHGQQGVYALVVESHHREKLSAELERVKAQRMELEHRVNLMRDASLDPDLLDEMARRSLGLAKPDEIVILSSDATAR